MGLILSKLSCNKLQPKPVTPTVSNDLQHWTTVSFVFHSSHGGGNKGSVVPGQGVCSRSRFMDGVRSELRWLCSFLLNIHGI